MTVAKMGEENDCLSPAEANPKSYLLRCCLLERCQEASCSSILLPLLGQTPFSYQALCLLYDLLTYLCSRGLM